MRKRIARTIFWLALISAASRHNILLGLVLYPFAAVTVAAIFLSPALLTLGLGLAWYWHRHRRLPDWTRRLVPDRVHDFGWRLRSPVRRRWPRSPRPNEAPTEELVPAPAPDTPAAAAAGRAAASHLAVSHGEALGNSYQGAAVSRPINPRHICHGGTDDTHNQQ